MATILDEAQIAELLSDPKPLSFEDMQRLRAPKLGRSEQHYTTTVDVTGDSGKKYRLTSRRNRHNDADFSVILAMVAGAKILNVIRCNGHHGVHPNRIEKTTIPSDTCHIHRITERYQRIKPKDPETFAEATEEYTGFTGAVDFFVAHFGVYVFDHPYGSPDGMYSEPDEA